MANQEVELELLNGYLKATLEAETEGDSNRNLALYRKQVAVCISEGVEFNQPWCEAMVYYLQAAQKQQFSGLVEKTLVGTAEQSQGFDGLLPLMLASGRSDSRAREGIVLLDKAISICDSDPDFWLYRARLHYSLQHKNDALRDVNYALTNFNDDKNVYMAGRKLKNEIDALSDKKGGCFIATAVYGTAEAPEVQLLRDYRDDVLLKSRFGRAFVGAYYRLSPPIARALQRTDTGRRIVRALLVAPIVRAVQRDWPKQTDEEASL